MSGQVIPITTLGRALVAGSTAAAMRTTLGLGNVENTALSTWAGSTSITTLGTIATGTVPAANVSGLGTLATLSAAPAGTLTGTTLAANVVTSSLTSVGTLSSGSIPYSLLTGTPSIPSAANPSGTVGLSVVNGSLSTYLRSDGSPALSQAIVPTWTGAHVWAPTASGAVAATFKASTTSPGNITEWKSSGSSLLSAITAVGYLSLPAGTVGAPAVGMQNNNVGFYQVSTNMLGVSIAGTTSGQMSAYGYRIRGDVGMFDWAASSDASAASDTSLVRTAAGVIAAGKGQSVGGVQNSGYGALRCGAPAAGTSPFRATGVASQTAALTSLAGRSSTTDDVDMAEVDTAWVDSTHATRKARLILRAYDTAAREGVRIDADGSAARLGFYGAAAVAQQVLATGAGATVDNVISALQNLGLVKQS